MRTPEQHAISTTIVKLMQGIVYREASEDVWRNLERHEAAVQDHFATIGVVAVIDTVEGYAFLRALDEVEGEDPLPRLVKRRTLTYPVSLLLLLLRKRLAEFEASGDEGKLVLDHERIVEMLRLFLRDTSDETRLLTNIDQTISKAVELGFLHRVREQRDTNAWEVRRILKAYVDAATMADFDERLRDYARAARGDRDDERAAPDAENEDGGVDD